MEPGAPAKIIEPPLSFPQEFDHLPPPVFFMEDISPKLAHKVQRILGFGPLFQTAITQPDEQFASPWYFALNLEHNTPPLTHFPLPKWKRDIQREFKFLTQSVSKQLKAENLNIISVDKGHGLVIVHLSDLQQMYKLWLDQNATRVPPYHYFKQVQDLRTLLAEEDPNLTSLQDDRPPTFYFKIKVHKPQFKSKVVYSPSLYRIQNSLSELVSMCRPIANHKPSITTLVSSHLRPLLTPIIENSPFLSDDIHEVIAILSHPSVNLNALYTYDIKSFYSSAPHQLILEAFDHYNPANLYTPILKALLPLNFITDGSQIYTLGTTGIPMGLPLAPELARMTTAYLLLKYKHPLHDAFTIYFDDIASTYQLPLDLLAPYVLEQGPDNVTQDALFDPTSHSFIQVAQSFRQPTPLHVASNHSSSNMLTSTWKAATLRSARIATQPKLALDNHYRRYMPHYMRAGHALSELSYAIADLMYYPRNTPKKTPPETTGISYNYSQTRPTKRQLAPITKSDFHLVPLLQAPALISLLQYSYPQFNLEHRITCRDRCRICISYDQRFGTLTPFPFEPCAHLRLIYVLHHPYVQNMVYVGQTGATKHVLRQPLSAHRIWRHLSAIPDLLWQVWKFLPPSYKPPSRMETSMELQVANLIRKHHPDINVQLDHPNRFYDALKSAIAPLPPISDEEVDP